jgi:hypothetical protein
MPSTTTMIHVDGSELEFSFSPCFNVYALNVQIGSGDNCHHVTLFMTAKQVARLADHVTMYVDEINGIEEMITHA